MVCKFDLTLTPSSFPACCVSAPYLLRQGLQALKAAVQANNAAAGEAALAKLKVRDLSSGAKDMPEAVQCSCTSPALSYEY